MKNNKAEITRQDLLDASICPNCWGHQEYIDQFQLFSKEVQITSSNKKSFITQFVETHVSGIKLKKQRAILSCPSCDFETNLQ